MTIAEQITIEKLNDIQLKISTAMARILGDEANNIERANAILGFARNDLIKLVGFLGKAPNKEEIKQ